MNKRIFWLSIAAVLLSFAGGFLLANSFNKNELSALRAENENLKRAQSDAAQSEDGGSLSDEEIRARIAEADANPSNAEFQKKLGLALYTYASAKKDTNLLRESARLVERVYEKNADDYGALVALGNINFDIGYFEKSNEYLQKARSFYEKALVKKPSDADVRTDLGLTYFLSNPPDSDKAVAEFQNSLKTSPNNARTLEALVKALSSQNKRDEAEKYAARLKKINPASGLDTNGEAGAADLQKQ